ncbi:MAG: hypothetical protein Tsb0032_32640 [Kiloniellaceae bacterium]
MLQLPLRIRRFATLVLPLGLAAGLLPGAPAGAAAEAAQLAQTEGVGGFSQPTLQAYAAAVRKVQDVDAAWQPKFSAAKTAEEIEGLTRQATDEMVAEIEAQGLSVQQYNDITKAAQQDNELYDRIMVLLAEAR